MTPLGRWTQEVKLPINGVPVELRPLTPPKSAAGTRTPYLGSLNASGTSTVCGHNRQSELCQANTPLQATYRLLILGGLLSPTIQAFTN
jgi:hypothetical protein